MLHRDLSILNSGEQDTLHHAADEFSSTFFFGSRCCMSKDVEILFRNLAISTNIFLV
jgi:hypothetical protein